MFQYVQNIRANQYPIIVHFLWGLLLSAGLTSCQSSVEEGVSAEQVLNDPFFAGYLHQLNHQLTEAIIQDGFAPPVASRIYAYSNLAAFEILVPFSNGVFRSMVPQLNQGPRIPLPEREVDPVVSLVTAYSSLARELIYRDFLMDTIERQIVEEYLDGRAIADFSNSRKWGMQVAATLLDWANRDGYLETRSKPFFVPSDSAGSWEPTPPTYAEAIEPYWYELRPFFLDSADQFRPNPPIRFDSLVGSSFFNSAMEVRDAVEHLGAKEMEIAKFWDCNPFLTRTHGHFMAHKRQLTPGGHWIGIAGTACQTDSLSLLKTAEVYALSSIALADAFISCWKEKYRSNLIRPETYINRYMDPDWVPVLETPMFPEHTSGHSVISSACGTVLTHLFGESFSYRDSVNVPFGLPARDFRSFEEAYREAAISRLYGGIHYRPAIENGIWQGESIGKFLLEKVPTRSN